MRSVIAWFITQVCLPSSFKRWSYNQRFKYAQRIWREVDSTIKIALAITSVFLVAVFLFSFSPACSSGKDCKESGYAYFFTSTPNEVGDALAGLAGSLAFLWLITTVFLQGKELKEQRKVLSAQKNEFAEQNANMREQIFDNTFFQMLATLGNIIEGIDLTSTEKGRTAGRDCFRVYYSRLSYNLANFGEGVPDFDVAIEEFFKKNGHEFGHYFRFLFNFYRFLDQSKYTKDHHFKVLRSTLSDYELLLMYYNCLTPLGKNFQEFLTRYEVFDNISVHEILDPSHLEKYQAAAFGNNSAYLEWRGARQ